MLHRIKYLSFMMAFFGSKTTELKTLRRFRPHSPESSDPISARSGFITIALAVALSFFLSFSLSSCGSDNKTDPLANPEIQTQQTQDVDAPSSASAGSVAGPAPQGGIAPNAAPALYEPSLRDVQTAFMILLMLEYQKVPISEQRDIWLAQEQIKIAQLTVDSCSKVPMGEPSLCRVNFNNSTNDIKLLLTRSGWEVTR